MTTTFATRCANSSIITIRKRWLFNAGAGGGVSGSIQIVLLTIGLGSLLVGFVSWEVYVREGGAPTHPWLETGGSGGGLAGAANRRLFRLRELVGLHLRMRQVDACTR